MDDIEWRREEKVWERTEAPINYSKFEIFAILMNKYLISLLIISKH